MNKEQKTTQERIPQKYGYVRISDSSQKVFRQTDFMEELGIPENNIFIDKQSGKDFNRSEYKRLYRKLKSDDTLYIKELDRLGRNKVEIKEELTKLRNKKIHVRITNIPTTMVDYPETEWIMDMMNNVIIEVLASVAEQERITNHQRQAEGIAAARARGVRLGRPPLKLPDNFPYYYNHWKNKTMTRGEILKTLNIDKVTWDIWSRSYRNQLEKKKKINLQKE